MERNVRLHEEMVGEQPAAVSEKDLQNAARVVARLPRFSAGLHHGSQFETRRCEHQENEIGGLFFHTLNDLRRNTIHVAQSSNAVYIAA